MSNGGREWQVSPSTPHTIGATTAACVIIAAVVGSGIFSLTGQFGAQLQTPANVLAAWIFGGILALSGALCFAELGAMMPCSGGSVEFARRAFGPTVGYLVAMVTILAGYILSEALVALFLAGYVDDLFAIDLPDAGIAAASIVLVLLTQLFSVRAGFFANSSLTYVKIGFVLAFVVTGLLLPLESRIEAPLSTTIATTSAPGFFSPAVALATLSVSFAYLGWSNGADIAGEVRSPGRNVPIAIIGAMTLVFVLYIGMNLVYLRVMDPSAMVGENGGPMPAIGATTARHLFGDAVGSSMGAVIALLFFSTNVAGLIGGARILESMAHAGEIPPAVGHRTQSGVPRNALLVVTVGALLALLLGSLSQILDLLVILITVFCRDCVATNHARRAATLSRATLSDHATGLPRGCTLERRAQRASEWLGSDHRCRSDRCSAPRRAATSRAQVEACVIRFRHGFLAHVARWYGMVVVWRLRSRTASRAIALGCDDLQPTSHAAGSRAKRVQPD